MKIYFSQPSNSLIKQVPFSILDLCRTKKKPNKKVVLIKHNNNYIYANLISRKNVIINKNPYCHYCKIKANVCYIAKCKQVKNIHFLAPFAKVENCLIEMTIDHVIPLSKNGPNTLENIVVCCYKCNKEKGAKLTFKP